MTKLSFTLAVLAAALAGPAFAQADNTNARVVPSGVPTDVYESGTPYDARYPYRHRYVYEPGYTVERRHYSEPAPVYERRYYDEPAPVYERRYYYEPVPTYERRYYYEPAPVPRAYEPLTAYEAETIYGYPYPYAYDARDRRFMSGAGTIGARQDSNPNDFSSGIYNPKR